VLCAVNLGTITLLGAPFSIQFAWSAAPGRAVSQKEVNEGNSSSRSNNSLSLLVPNDTGFPDMATLKYNHLKMAISNLSNVVWLRDVKFT